MTRLKYKLFLIQFVITVFLFSTVSYLAAGTISSPVSVAVPTGMSGSLNSRPVSVGVPVGMEGALISRPVSVGNPTSMVAGNYLGLPASVGFQPEKNGDPDLVAIWHMDGNWGDSSGNGNNALSFNGVAFSTDRRGGTQAGSFDGSDDHIVVPNSTTLNPSTQITVSAWYKPSSFSGTGNDSLVDKGFTSHTAPYYQYHLGVSGDRYVYGGGGTFTFSVAAGGVSRGVTTPASFWTPGNWYHIVGTYDGSAVRLYVNGLLIGSTPASGAISNYGKNLFIGRFGNLTACLPGIIDEVAIYKRALSAEEIAVQYASGVNDPDAPESPVLDTVPAVVGSASIVLSGASTPGTSIWVNNKKIAPAAESANWSGSYGTLHPGVNIMYITAVDASFRQSQPVTATVFYDNLPPMVQNSSPANSSNTAKVVSSVAIELYDAKSPLDLPGSLLDATVANLAGEQVPGTWSHSGERTITFTPAVPFPQSTYRVTVYPVDAVGNRGQHQIVFTNHDTASPVTRLSASVTPDRAGWYAAAVTATLAADDGSEGSGIDKIEYSTDSGATWQTYTAPLTFDSDGRTIMLFRATDKAGNVETPKSHQIKINKTGLIGEWKMDGDLTDSSMLQNTGIPYGGTALNATGKLGINSASFDGTGGIKMNDIPEYQHMNKISIEAWIKPHVIAPQGKRQSIVSFKEGISPNVGAVLALPEDAPNKVRFWVQVNGTWTHATSSQTITPNAEWYHVVGTYDGLTIRVYVNGQPTATIAPGEMTNAPGSSTSTVTIGAGASNQTAWYNGLIDEVALYNRPLSDIEVQQHYRNFSINVPTVEPVTSPTRSAEVALRGTKPANTAVVVNGVTVAPLDENSTWEGTYTLSSGGNSLSITAMDADGYHSPATTLPVILDDTPPVMTASDPADGGFFKSSVSAIAFTLKDAFSDLDFAATTSAATAKDSAGNEIAGSWAATGTGANGVVTFTPAAPLGEGSYTATINPTDSFGNGAAATIGFTVDMTPPPSPTIDPITLPINSSSKIITGAKSSDSTRIIVTCPGATTGTVSYPSATTWSVTVSNLKEGGTTVSASAFDKAGNESAAVQMTFSVDLTPPAKPVIAAQASPTRSGSVTLTGSKEANSYLYVNNVKSVAGFAESSWSYSANLAEGGNSFSVFAKDEAGNQSQTASVAVVRDTTSPGIASSTPAANSVTAIAGSVTVTLSDSHAGADLQASLDGATVKNSTGTVVAGTWSASGSAIIFSPAAALAEGSYLITLYPVDTLGNKGSASFSFTVDRAAPTLQGVTLSPASPVKAGTVNFTITFSETMNTAVAPVVTVTRPAFLGNTSYQLTGSWQNATTWRGSYNFSADSGDATYTIRAASARDKAGNVMTEQTAGSFILDTTAPEKPSVAAVTTPTKTASQALTGTKQAETAIVINNVVRVPVSSATTWSYNYPLNEGVNTLSVTARDAAGNDSPAITPAPVVTLDTTPPLFTVDTYKTPSPTVTQTISGTREPGSLVKLNGVTIVEAADQSATWSHTLTLTDGINNRLVFMAVDPLGNSSTKTLDILCETAPPPALAAGMLVADGSGKGSEVTLNWPSYVETSVLGYYRVYFAGADFTSVSALTPAGTVTKGSKTFKVTGLTQGSRYWFAVVPVSVSGNSHTAIHTASAVPADTVPPEEVTGLTAWAGHSAADGNTVTVSWTPSANAAGDLADQLLYVDGGDGYDAGTSLGKGATSYSRTGLNDATVYKFKVAAKDALGHLSPGSVVTAVTRLANPTGLTATPGNQKVTLSWSPVTSPYLKAYNIYRLQSGAQQGDVSAMTLVKNQTGTSFTDTGLTNGTSYQYAVTALNSSGAERTNVASVTAVPRGDTTGPVLGSVNLTANQVVTAPVTITAAATDAESAMARVEIHVDGALAATQNGGSVSYSWNVVDTTDGNHSVKIAAYDSAGNVTEKNIAVVVSLAPPATPIITSSFASPINQKSVTITGTTQPGSTLSLRVNGTVVAQQTAAATFSFSAVPLAEGDNLIAAKAGNRGGESPFSADTRISVVTAAPAAPVALAAKPLAGGSVQFSWRAGATGAPVGYNLYEVPASFTALTDPGVKKTNAALIPYLLKEYIPADDAARSYLVTAVDAAGNESPASSPVTVASDRTAPAVSVALKDGTGVTPPDNVYGPGAVQFAVTVSEPLSENPFFSIEPQKGTPVLVPLWKSGDNEYRGDLPLAAAGPNGPTTWRFSAKDLVGNRGSATGTGPAIDVRGPVATVTAPLTLLKTTAGPAAVSFVLDEPSATTPSLILKGNDGVSAEVTGLVSVDNGVRWSGTVDPGALAEGTGQFLLAGAEDRFGNTGSTVKSGGSIILFQNAPPAAAVPTGLSAKAGKGGSIALAWGKVADASGYKIYRKGEGDAAPVLLASVAPATAVYSDTPDRDGSYSYSISSVGLLEVESAMSEPVSAASDRTPPEVPSALALSITGNGVRATWDVASAPAEVPAGYRLYRGAASFSDLAGLAPVASVAVNSATDPAPASGLRFYAVTALDARGNESAPCAVREITFPVAPVATLDLAVVDEGKPSLSWSTAEANLLGFYIYRNGSKVNQTLTTSRSFSDSYYAGGAVTYGVSAVDANGTEGPVREVTLPALTVALKEGATMHRGLLETVTLAASLTAGATESLTVDAVAVKVGSLPESTLNGPFTVQPGATLEIEKVAATETTASPQLAVVVTAIQRPAPGTTVRLTRSSLASVLGSGTALEIFSEPLVRGTEAQVRIKVNNLGRARTEFLTSENGGATPRVTVYLKDQDGNVLVQGNLNQQTGNVVNSGSYTTARIEPGESFLSAPITFPVPTGVPNRVSLVAVIDATYYHYNQDSQVVAPGLKQSVEATIAEVPYSARAQVARSMYKAGEAVTITGQALSASDGSPVPAAAVKIGVSVKGFDRFFTATTDGTGSFSYTFTAGSSETGTYSVWASHPEVAGRSVQAEFSILGMSISPETVNVTTARNRGVDVPISIRNLAGATLSGVTLSASSSSGIEAVVLNGGSDTLAGGESRTVNLRITPQANAPDYGYVNLGIATAEGLTDNVQASVRVLAALPAISASPSYIDTGLVRGSQKVASFTIGNTGIDTLINARVEGPSLPWLSLNIDKNLGDIGVNQKKTIGLLMNPGEEVAQGVYDDRIVIYADNHIPYTYRIQATVTSNAVGNVQFNVIDVLMRNVANASITLQNQSVLELIQTVKTGADGSAALFDLPEGRYSFNISASGARPYSGSFVIEPGVTTAVPVGLELNLVQIEWSVTPVVIEDSYTITVTQTFETNVPAPVLVTEPPSVTFPAMQPGQVYNGEFTVTNYGLIAVENVAINFPTSFDDFDVEILATAVPKRLSAMQKITVPYRITRREATSSGTGSSTVASLLDEVQCFGGATCYKTIPLYTVRGTAIICQNTPQERSIDVITTYTGQTPTDCPPVGGGGPTYDTSIGYGGTSQSSGTPGPGISTPIKTENPCDCQPEETPCPGPGGVCRKDVCRGGTCVNVPDDDEVPPQLKFGDCKKQICRGGSVVTANDDDDGCVDEFYCTSFEGEPGKPGRDKCSAGKCRGKEIKDKQLGPDVGRDGDFPLAEKPLSYIQKLLSFIPGDDWEPEITYSGSAHAFRRCCENSDDFRDGIEGAFTVNVSLAEKEFKLFSRLVPIPVIAVPIYVEVNAKVGAQGSATRKEDSNPCAAACSGSTEVGVSVGGSVSGTFGTPDGAIVDDPLLSVVVTGSVAGQGTVTFPCTGGAEGDVCLGKVEAEVKAMATNWTMAAVKWPVADGFCIK